MINYGEKKIHDFEFLDHYVNTRSRFVNKSKKLKMLYAGDVGCHRQGFDVNLLQDIVENLDSSYEFLLASYDCDCEQARVIEKKFSKYQNFRFLGQLEAQKLENIAKDCEFGLVLYSPEYIYYNITSFLKTSFYIANGLTVISTNLKRTKELNEKYNFGYVFQKEELIAFIKNLSSKKIKRNILLEKQISNGIFLNNILKKLKL